MAGITQTIPNYMGGMSEQPDQLKRPGQVRSIVNGIPDVTYGLYKRPGSKRVAQLTTNKYGTSAIPSGGSWFHYYRDESEGAYIGQVDSNGKIRIWSCKDGSEKNVWYVTDNTAFNSGTAAHTSITSYLTPTTVNGVVQTEDIQALTINDSTFLNNRTKTVTTTGTTDTGPNSHFAYVELQKTENGRQYGLNVNNDGNSGNTIKRATRVEISADTLSNAGGSGGCRGIGTQVFSANKAGGNGTGVGTGNGKNLIFRLTILGQAGVRPNANADDSGIDGGGYMCSYNKRVELLHGGEGWGDGDEVTVTMTQADGGAGTDFADDATFTIKVTKIETVNVAGNVDVCRPEPTPFDADTCVTTDTILGGIQTELSGASSSGSALSTQVIGNGLYISCASAFNVQVVDKDLMKVTQGEIDSIQDLPLQCKHGIIVKITNSKNSDDDDIYMKFKGNNDKDGPGAWVECPAPGIVKSFNAATMPHILQRQEDGEFLVKQYEWADREVGDDETNLIPTFVNKKINRVLFFRNRLTFLSDTNAICSRAGKLNNFWANTALTVSATDPIDITSTSTFPSDLYDGIEIAAGLLLFSSNQQFLLTADAEIFSPDTAKLKPISAYNYNIKIPPISTGVAVGYIDNSGKYSRFNEMINVGRENEPLVGETSKLVPTLLSKDIDLLTISRENSIIFFGKTGSSDVIGYKYFQNGQQREQSAWFKWKFKNTLRYHFVIDDEYFLLDINNYLQKVNIIQADSDPSIDQDGVNYLIHLDNWTTVANGSYDATTSKTTFTDQSDWIDTITNGSSNLVVVDTDSNTLRVGKYAECTVINNDDFTVPGDWSSSTLNIGYLYDYQVDFPRMYVTQQQGREVVADVNSSLVLHRIKLNFGKIGLYETTLTRMGKDPYTEIYESALANVYGTSDAPYLDEEIKTIPIYEKNENVDITLKSTHPSPAVLHSVSWEGDYSQKYYRRA